jgi:hypothetical protein
MFGGTMNHLDKESSDFLDELYKSYGGIVIEYAPKRVFDDWDKRVQFGSKTISIEEKTRARDYGDILVELVEDLKTLDPGWIYQTKADRLVYCVLEPRLVYALPMGKLKDYVFDNIRVLLRNCNISDQGYGKTLNIFVPTNLGKLIYPRL